MGIQIGRVGVDIDGLQTPLGYGGYRAQGDVLVLQGRARASTLQDSLWLREQLRALVGNPDEPWVRLVWDDAEWVNGLYAVESVDVDSFGLTLTTGGFPYSVTLRRLAAYGTPTFESWVTYGGPMSNVHSATATPMYLALPATATRVQGFVSGAEFSSGGARSVSGAANLNVYVPSYGSSTAYTGSVAWACPIANVYEGTCRLEVLVDGNYRTLLGRQVPAGLETSWRLTNDLIRVTPGTSGRIAVSVWDGSAWTTAKEYTTNGAFTGTTSAATQFAVLRNGPDQVIIRLWMGFSASVATVLTVDIGITRGSRLASCAIAHTRTPSPTNWTIERSTGEAGTSLNDLTPVAVGLRASANDAQGDRYVLVSDHGNTLTGASGRIQNSVARMSLRFGLGLEVNGSGAGAPNTATVMATEFMSNASISTQVRVR